MAICDLCYIREKLQAEEFKAKGKSVNYWFVECNVIKRYLSVFIIFVETRSSAPPWIALYQLRSYWAVMLLSLMCIEVGSRRSIQLF